MKGTKTLTNKMVALNSNPGGVVEVNKVNKLVKVLATFKPIAASNISLKYFSRSETSPVVRALI